MRLQVERAERCHPFQDLHAEARGLDIDRIEAELLYEFLDAEDSAGACEAETLL